MYVSYSTIHFTDYCICLDLEKKGNGLEAFLASTQVTLIGR